MQKNIIAAAAAALAASASASPVLGTDLTEPLSDTELEQRVEALKPTAPRITKEHIQSLIVDETYTNLEGTRTTVCRLELANGFCVVGVNNGPVSAANFSQEIGCEYAYKAAVDQIWPLEGYLLAERLFRAATEDEKVAKLRELVAIQTAGDPVDQAEHMRGMTNGLLLALSVFTGQEPAFVDPPAPTEYPEGATHVGKPVPVTARKIADVKGTTPWGDDLPTNHAHLVFEDGTYYEAGAEMTARYWPVAGDYLVREAHGYEYLNPADVFERKYSALV